MAGTLTIHSSGDGHLLSGHSWIEYHRDGETESTTYGTWGNNPTGKGNGLFKDLEKGRSGDAQRSARLDDDQEKRLFDTIKRYEDEGQGGWKYLNPCSGFAQDAWHSATGEKLGHRRLGISNPSTLKNSINKANGAKKGGGTKSKSRPASSRRKVRDPCEECAKAHAAIG